MDIIVSLLGAIVVLGVLVVVHELGHYGAARMVGIRVMEFAVGFGPKLISGEKNGIVYSLRAFPLGGFCRFYGEDEEIRDEASFAAQRIWKRFIVLFSGAFLNIVFAIVLAVVTLSAYGDIVPAFIEVNPGLPAAAAGLLPGDQIVSVNGKEVGITGEVASLVVAADPEGMEIVVRRGGKLMAATVTNFFSEERGSNYIGVSIGGARRSFAFGEAVSYSFKYVWYIIREMFAFLGSLFVPGTDIAGNVMGFVGTISVISDAVRLGFETVLRLAMLISINLGIVNLLPFPGLDGARLVFLGIEKARGRALPPEREGMVHFVGLVLLLGLMVFLTYGDIVRLIGG